MKIFTFLVAMLFAATNAVHADAWIQKKNFGGAPRGGAVGFSIGTKGYVGTGVTGNYLNNVYYNDLWEYDPTTNVWTQKADFGGVARSSALGFSIGSKGYVLGGASGNYPNYVYYNDFWEYDPSTNTWTQKENYPGLARVSAVGFSIDSIGYVGTGGDAFVIYKEFWAYNPTSNTWSQKADFGGLSRNDATGFSIGSKGYIGIGFTGEVVLTSTFWEYDPATDTWTQKANFGGLGRVGATGFSIGTKGYIGTGRSGSNLKDFWEYDPGSNTWTQKTDFGGGTRAGAVGFSIGSKGYIGLGYNNNGSISKNFWEYTPDVSCSVPVNLLSTNITSTSAKLKWNAVPGAIKYNLRYKIANTNTWTTLNPEGHSKTINGLSPNTAYKWQVRTVCQIGPDIKSDWSPKQDFTTLLRLAEEPLPQVSFQLYPNPAQDYSTIQFTLTQASHVSIKVYDMSGREMKTILNDNLDEGNHTLQLNIKDFPEGIYFVKMISDFGIQTQKMMVQ